MTVDIWQGRVLRDDLWDYAWSILADAFTYPPSLEVFEFGLEEERMKRQQPLSAVEYAKTLEQGCAERARRRRGGAR